MKPADITMTKAQQAADPALAARLNAGRLPATPGPWYVSSFTVPDGKCIISAGMNRYGDGPASDVGTINNRADAALAAAAPALLAALQAYLAAPLRTLGQRDDALAILERLESDARTAIAAAQEV